MATFLQKHSLISCSNVWTQWLRNRQPVTRWTCASSTSTASFPWKVKHHQKSGASPLSREFRRWQSILRFIN